MKKDGAIEWSGDVAARAVGSRITMVCQGTKDKPVRHQISRAYFDPKTNSWFCPECRANLHINLPDALKPSSARMALAV
jgi:hypothetical protein